MATLQDILGGGLPPGLLTPEQEAAAVQRAQNAGLLNFAFGALQASRGQPGQRAPSLAQVIGQAGPVGVAGYQQSFDQTLANTLRGMQVAEMQRKRQQEEAGRAAMRRLSERVTGITPEAALAAPGEQVGPTVERAAMIGQRQALTPDVLIREAFAENISPDVQRSLLTAASLMAPKEGKETFRPMTEAEKRSAGLPVDRTYQISSSGKIDEVGKGPLVVMTEGEKGFKNEMELKSAFKNEPVYKAQQEMRSAYGQVTESLSKGTPAGDLAGATKFMKLLDPGSVVRESELYLAMSATGALDRFTNYANSVIKGTKLTPAQRKDFQQLADKLFTDSMSTYNAKRNEYIGLGSSYGLNAERALGPAAELPVKAQVTTGSLIDQVNAELKRRGL